MPLEPPSEAEARKAEAKIAEMKLYERIELPSTAGNDNGVAVVWFGDRSLAAKDCDLILVYIHGGGFNLFHTGMYVSFFHALWMEVTEARGINKFKILSIDYALAPERTWPYQLLQIERAYSDYLLGELGVDPEKVVICMSRSTEDPLFASLTTQFQPVTAQEGT
jgi:acetyl esterase/lipase